MKGWLDKYGKEINANEGYSSAPENWEGEGYSNVGRNYSPAWGGQFEDGGQIPQAQKGKKLPPIYTDDPRKIRTYQDSLNLYRVGEAELKRFYNGDPGQSYGKIKNLQDLNKATKSYSGEIPKNQLYNTSRDLLNSKGNISKISSIYNRTGILPTEFWASQGSLNYRFKKPVQPYILQKPESEPKLKKKVFNVQPIPYNIPAFNTGLRPMGSINIESSSIQQNPATVAWNVEYFDPMQKKTVTKSFGNNEEAERFYNDPANKASYKYSDVSGVGRFAMGGSLPGSVGFTYARTNSPAPSEGPYAKKTLPSAEYGMSYYQHGLDWKPRNISENGSLIPIAQTGDFVLPKYTMPRAGSESTSVGVTSKQRLPETERQIDVAKKIAKQPQIKQGRKSTPAEEAERRRRNAAYASTLPNAQYNEQTGDVERINPNRGIAGEAQNFMSEREDQKGEDALTALEIAGYLEGAGALGSAAKKAVAKSMESGLLSNTYKLNPWALKENPEMFLYRTQPKNFVAGYTEEQYLKDLITDKILKGEKVPFYLQGKLNQIKYKPEPFRKALDEYHGQWFDKNPERMDFYMKGRLDGDEGNILRLKVPKEEGAAYNLKNFPEAQKASLNYDTEFIVPKNKLNQAESFSTNDWQQLIQEDKKFNTPNWLRGYKEVPKPTSTNTSVRNPNDVLKEYLKEKRPSWFIEEPIKTKTTDELARIETSEFLKDILKNPDKQALYTPVDLRVPRYGDTNLGLNPSSEGGRKIRLVDEGSGLFTQSADKFGEGYNLYDLLHSTNYHIRKNKQGGVVKDDMGYWNPDNWGKVVEIDSPNITMQGVYEPLIGISKQTGERKVMLPGKDYTFANTKQVIEKPLNKKSTGGWLDKYGL